MFFDIFEFKLTHVDEQPITEDSRLRFYSDGRIESFKDGNWRFLTPSEAQDFVDRIVKGHGLAESGATKPRN